jgi:hypothetical protein
MKAGHIGRLLAIMLTTSLAVPAAVPAGPVGPPVYQTDFEDGVAWSPRPGMQCEVIDLAGRGKVLHVWGHSADGWNYATTGGFELLGGHLYRFSGWTRLNSADPQLPPYFKVEYTGGPSGRMSTEKYDAWNPGWQELVAEFEVPAGTTGGWIAVEKGTDQPVSVDLYVDDVVVQEIDSFSPHEYHFDTVPAPLAALMNTHPRIYLTAERLSELRQNIANEPFASMLQEVLDVADRGVRDGPPAYQADGDQEQLWQRPVGNRMPHLCLAYLLTGDNQYLQTAEDFMLASAGYPTWGLGSIDGTDLATGHQLFGMALCYDWLFSDLDAGTLQTVRDCLLSRGQFMFDKLLSKQVWWEDSYLQNHQWVNMTGLSAAGFALFGGPDDVDGWILLPLEKFQRTMQSLGPDGASHEGIPYWSYGVEYMLKFMDLAGQLLEEDLFTQNAWFENTAYFRLYGMLPENSWQSGSSLMTFADAPRHDWYGPDYMLRRLAAEYQDGHAQWLADELDEANLCGWEARFLNLLWVDPVVAPVPPDGLPTHRHFDDMDIVYMRSGWNGDESLLAFKCGPHIGHHAVQAYSYDPGGGHVHPDAGSFLLFSHGDWLIVDDGYTYKTTEYQNTALVNGVGQEGEGSAWFQGSSLCAESRGARITRADFAAETNYLIGDVTAAYKEEAGLLEFLRHVMYIKPYIWVIVDEFESSSASTYELYLHADFPFEDLGQNMYRAEGSSGSLSMKILKPSDVAHQAFVQPLTGTDGGPEGDIQALELYNSSPTQRTLFLMVLEAYPTGTQPQADASIQDVGGGEELVLQTPSGESRWRLDPDRADRTARVLVEPGVPDEDGGDYEDAGGGDSGGEDAGGEDAGGDDSGGEDAGTIGGSCGCGNDHGALLALPLLLLLGYRRLRIRY